MSVKSFMRLYLWIAVACFAMTLVLYAILMHKITQQQCAKSLDLKEISTRYFAAILFGAWCIVFFSLSVTEYGQRQLRELARSPLGLFPLISYPRKIYFIHIVLFICCAFTLANPLAAFLMIGTALRECGPI